MQIKRFYILFLFLFLFLFILFIAPISLLAEPTEVSKLSSSGALGPCQIDLTKCHLTRQIGIGAKIFKPVHAKIDLTFNNSSGEAIIVKHLCYLYDSNNEKYLLTCGLQKQHLEPISWSGEIPGAKKTRVLLGAWDGPKLDPGTTAFIVINFYDDKGNSVWLRSSDTTIKGLPEHRSDFLPQNDIFNQVQ